MSYDEVIGDLRRAYDGKVEERAGFGVDTWKDHERLVFLDRLVGERARTLLEVGAGTGVHGRFFADAGLQVVCTDLSPAMVKHCRADGLEAYEQDFLSLDLGRTFAAGFAMNCLLHVPIDDLPAAAASIAACLDPGALFFWGQYGGVDDAGPRPDDHYEPKRFFSSLSDEHIVDVATSVFDLVDFHPVDVGFPDEGHFQSLTLRVRRAGA